MNDVFSEASYETKHHRFTADDNDYLLLKQPDSCSLVEGNFEIYIAPEKNANSDNAVFLCKIEADGTIPVNIPGLSAEDDNNAVICFMIKGSDGSAAIESIGKSTDTLRKNFAVKRIGIQNYDKSRYAQIFADRYIEARKTAKSASDNISASDIIDNSASDIIDNSFTDINADKNDVAADRISKENESQESNIIKLDGASRFITREADTAYRLVSGQVYILIAKLDWDGNIERARPYSHVADAGSIFPSFYFTDADFINWSFVLVGRGNTEIERLPNNVTEQTQKDFIYTQPKASKITEFEYTSAGYNGSLKNLYDTAVAQEKVSLSEATSQDIEYTFKNLDLLKSNTEDNHIEGDSPLYLAVAYACKALNMELLSEAELKSSCSTFSVNEITTVSGIACRSILLDSEWYKSDCGAFVSDIDGVPVAVVPSGWTGYKIYYSDIKKSHKLSAEESKKISPNAYAIYRTLPGKSLTKKDLFNFGLKCVRKGDLIAVVILMLVTTVLGLLIPTLNQQIYDDYIPVGNVSFVVQICSLITAFMMSRLMFEVVESLSKYRIGSRISYALQNAVFYRIFHLPEKFFRDAESADLAMRLSYISGISSTITSAILSSGIGGILSLLYLWKMFKYAKSLSALAILMILVYSVLLFFLSKSTMKMKAQEENAVGKANSKLYQYLSGIEKIRMSGSEERAVNQYLKPFSERLRVNLEASKISGLSAALSGAASTVMSMCFYYLIIKKNVDLSTGAFMAFNSAFGSFSGAMLELVSSALSIYSLSPLYERFKPIIETAQEDDINGERITSLKGGIELNNVTFSYSPDSPTVLKGINLKIAPGEYVGIVGRSGCGKSTLLKLLLGFENPVSGSVLYDDKDIRNFNKRSLRKNLGVVLQNGQLISGSIAENISITAPSATIKDIEKVVEMVALKNDIARMPMGLQTILTEDAGVISGGQKQRILIARAIINNPSILIFDEATSALDNISQAAVCESLDSLKSTRIVVAHKLSTIIKCDRIIVLNNGVISEEGNYNTLMALKGEFYQLAQRQLAGEDDV